MGNKCIIMGIGSGGRNMYSCVEAIPDMEVEFFLDRSPKEDFLLGVPVRRTDLFLKETSKDVICSYIFLLNSAYCDEIYANLRENGVPVEHIWSLAKLFRKKFFYYREQIHFRENISFESKETIIFDLGSGFVLGGVETWSYMLAEIFLAHHQRVLLLSDDSDYAPPENLQNFAVKISDVHKIFDFQVQTVQRIVDELQKHLPFVVFAAHVDDVLVASVLLREAGFPVKIISMIHGGLDYIIRDNAVLSDMVDYLFPVSIDAVKVLIEKYDILSEKVLFKETPVDIPDITDRTYSSSSEPLQIGYAGRLEVLHKHSELIIPLICLLEEKKVNYRMNIAGGGSLYSNIENFITENHLEERIVLLGVLDKKNMKLFWEKNDVAINLSVCEGCSVVMLESMANGTVPVFTDVFSSRHFIHDGKNGYVVPFGDLEQMADKIEYLEKNRQCLKIFGKAAHLEIAEKCRLDDYFEYIFKYI